MINDCNYSDQWQSYIGDYDKFEYDILLQDGTIVENCYPNADKFHSISDAHRGQHFHTKDIVEIRFSQVPRWGINEGVSSAPQYKWLDEQSKKREQQESTKERVSLDNSSSIWNDSHGLPPWMTTSHPRTPPKVTEPKIGRNTPCPCGSGGKYKTCCGKLTK